MKLIMTTFFMLSILCLSLVPHQTVADDHANSTDLIEHACERSRSRDFCVSSLRSDPTSQHADLRGLASIAIKLAHKNATDIMGGITAGLAVNNDTNTDPVAQQALYDCSDNYLDAAEQLENSLSALSENAYHDADVSNWVKAAVADAKSCDATIEGLKYELSHQNRVFLVLAKNALAILQVLTG